jgi:hypothetical protein
MKRVQGNPDVALLECTNPIRNKWRVRWDVVTDDAGTTSYMEKEFGHKPSINEIKSLIEGWISDATRERIISGFSYEGVPVWLSAENQANYERAYIQSKIGTGISVVFKFGTDDNPVYRRFEKPSDLEAFYRAFSEHIQQAQLDGWNVRDSIDLEPYRMD